MVTTVKPSRRDGRGGFNYLRTGNWGLFNTAMKMDGNVPCNMNVKSSYMAYHRYVLGID